MILQLETANKSYRTIKLDRNYISDATQSLQSPHGKLLQQNA